MYLKAQDKDQEYKEGEPQVCPCIVLIGIDYRISTYRQVYLRGSKGYQGEQLESFLKGGEYQRERRSTCIMRPCDMLSL